MFGRGRNYMEKETIYIINKKMKKSSKYKYIRGKQITDPESGKRIYDINNYRLPSVTTILAATKDQTFLKNWKAKVGDEEAERIKNLSGRRGTAMHKFLENHITGVGYDDLTPIGCEAKPMAQKLLKWVLRLFQNTTVQKLCYTILGCMLGLLISYVFTMI